MYYTDDTSELFYPPDDEWKPVYWTPMKNVPEAFGGLRSLGYDIIHFAENQFTPPRGIGQGKKIVLSPFQKWTLIHMFELKLGGNFRYKEVYVQISRKNWKSLMASIIAAYFGTKGRQGDEIYIAAKDSGQAEIVYKEVYNNVLNSDSLNLIFNVTKDVIENKYTGVTIKRLTADAMKVHGKAPYISICDELHTWDSETGRSTRGQDMIDALVTGSGDREESMVIYITTAGSNFEGVAYARYDKGKQIAQGGIEDDSFGFFCWEAEEHDPIDDPKTWRKANPGLVAGFLPMSSMEEAYKSAEQMDLSSFERYRLNKWVRKNESEGYIMSYHWDNALNKNFKKIPEGAEITVGFDGSLTDDSTGFVGLDLETGLMEVLYKWENDMTDSNWFVDVEEVKAAMVKIQEKYDVKLVYADPSRHQEVVKTWIRDYGRQAVRDIPPTPARMFPMCEEFRTDLYTGVLSHNGNKRFKEHVLNAVTSIRGLPKKEKPDSPLKIDFLICAVLANGARREWSEKKARIEAMAARYK